MVVTVMLIEVVRAVLFIAAAPLNRHGSATARNAQGNSQLVFRKSDERFKSPGSQEKPTVS